MPDPHDAAPVPDPPGDAAAWSDVPLREVVSHLRASYHRPLEAELPRLVALAEAVTDDLGEAAAPSFGEVLETLRALAQSLLDHMLKEEQILFPLVSSGQGTEAGVPVEVMAHEHAEAEEYLACLRRLTGDYALPAEAGPGVKALWAGLAALDTDLQAHMWLEDEILFPRALDPDT